MATRKHCIASIFMSCSVFMSALGRSIDNDSAALKSHFFMTFGNLLKVTGHPFWRFAENRYCALNISPIFIKFSPNVLQCMQNMVKL